MVELETDNGDHYVNRNLILRELANIYNESATKFAIYELANQNAEKAMEVGVAPEYSYVYRHHARNLIESNHCQEGLEETEALIAQTGPQDPIIDTYNIYLTEAYLCLNELDKALVTAQKLQCDDPVSTCKSGFLAEIYYQSGDWENALDTLNRMIQTNPNYGAWRYYIRADILYELGEAEYAQQDLDMGQKYSWFGNGVYWYVNAKMAFDKGDEENGVLYLQYAESTLDVQYNPLRQKILAELIKRGGSPLALSPQIPYNAPPMP
jgi:tetratricopeptide (TPR) repeat protein